ncbi:hypothetical protein D9M71_464210 [compost metagenome]
MEGETPSRHQRSRISGSASYEKAHPRMRLSHIRILYPRYSAVNLYGRFWGTHAAEHQGQFTGVDCQNHHRRHHRAAGTDRLRRHLQCHQQSPECGRGQWRGNQPGSVERGGQSPASPAAAATGQGFRRFPARREAAARSRAKRVDRAQAAAARCPGGRFRLLPERS